ncbi:DUF6042 family protein [Actinokineospora pegani]|uniref:DUF6042 family protein n=1 Tax=Actinokineospora pegani TaxID=2654637 RepID=UPI0012E9DD39|nr:DUF6042 family protein [Actinokineospora pegani]
MIGPWAGFLPPGASEILGTFCSFRRPTQLEIVRGVDEGAFEWGQIELFTAEEYQELLDSSPLDAAAGLSLDEINEETTALHHQRLARVASYARQLNLPPPDTIIGCLDYLVSAGLLDRSGLGPEASYWLHPDPLSPRAVFELDERDQTSLKAAEVHHHWSLSAAIIELTSYSAELHGEPITIPGLARRLHTDASSTRAALEILRLDPDLALTEDLDAETVHVKHLKVRSWPSS